MKKITLQNINKTLKVIDPDELREIKENIVESLSEDDIKNYLGNDTLILTYPDLSRYETIDQLFNGRSYVILLYLQSQFAGHWTSILNYTLNGQRIIEHHDSYGISPDRELTFNSPLVNRQLGQGTKYLTLLYKKALQNGYKVIYNKTKLQQFNKDKLTHISTINTCGRFAIFRILMYKQYKMDLYMYISYMKGLKTKYKISWDDIVSLIII